MKYNLKIELKQNLVKKRIDFLIKKGATIQLKEILCNRTPDQNRLYWLWLGCIESETGNDKDDLHQYFKMKFLGIETVNILGEEIIRPKSTANKDTKEFKDYIEKVRMFALVDLGIDLPEPGEKHFDEFYLEYYQN